MSEENTKSTDVGKRSFFWLNPEWISKGTYFLLVLTLLSGCSTFQRIKSNKLLASADLKNESFQSVVPIEYISNLPVFEVTIQGEVYRFIFDTGGYTVFSERLTDRLIGLAKPSYIDVKDGNSTVSRINTYFLDELEIGGITFEKEGFATIGFTESEWFSCLGLDGTIGPNIMKEALWEVDSQEGHIILSDKSKRLEIVDSGHTIPLYTDPVFKPSLDLQIGKEIKRVGFDTGFNGFLKLIGKPSSDYLDSYPSVLRLGNRTNAGNSIVFSDTKMVKLDEMGLNGIVFRNVITSVGNQFSSDLLGSQLFDQYKILIDLSGKALYLEEFETKPERQTKIESFGFGLDFRAGKVVIDYVYQPSAAHDMGVKPGQEILKINGRHYAFSSYCEFIENFQLPMENTMELELLQEDKPFFVSLTRQTIL
ncbi:hypothetical protein ACFOSV_06630 [Algoriphagus namhaensis]|uniref:PDZ domain-containing protein n=1 Tax=Algoriphagus namhaensis TaxID=915353 RepID=A0ABV8APF8_9BACT